MRKRKPTARQLAKAQEAYVGSLHADLLRAKTWDERVAIARQLVFEAITLYGCEIRTTRAKRGTPPSLRSLLPVSPLDELTLLN